MALEKIMSNGIIAKGSENFLNRLVALDNFKESKIPSSCKNLCERTQITNKSGFQHSLQKCFPTVQETVKKFHEDKKKWTVIKFVVPNQNKSCKINHPHFARVRDTSYDWKLYS